MTKTDALIFACKKVLSDRRAYLDTHDVKSIQLTVTLNSKGDAHVLMNERSEATVIDCFEGHARVGKYEFK